MQNDIENVIATIDYIETHLSENLDLDGIAEAVNYSKYHLHRMFTATVGMTIHDYVQRRRLTEAAKLLVFTDRPILEIALIAGYESQQAFTAIFKEMYKKTPGRYREEEEFYPLQLRYVLNKNPMKFDDPDLWKQRITFAAPGDIPEWMNLVRLVIDGFPHLDEEKYEAGLREYIACKRALILKDGDTAVGIMAFQEETGSIDFLGVHPQYRKQGIARAFLQKVREEFMDGDAALSVTTFREGDKADTGCRDICKKLGFAEAELLVEFGYPTQRFIKCAVDDKAKPHAAAKCLQAVNQPVAHGKKAQQTENPLARDFDIKSLLRFALPTIVMMIFMGLYTIVDTVFVSRFVNTDALSAMNIVCPVINLIVGLGTMLATGGSAIIARKMGAGEERRASQDFTLIVLAGMAAGLLISLGGAVFIDDIIWGLGASPLLFSYCKEYLLVILIFAPASMMQVLFQNLIVTAGRPGFGMALSVSAGAANILLDYVFMVPLQMGIRGSALGTGIGYLIPTLAGIWFFAGRRGGLKFCRPKMDFSVLAESCFNGFSEMVSQMASAVTTFLFNMVMMRLLGESGVAAVTIMIYTQFMLTALYIGFSMGVAPVISYNYGRGDGERLKKIFRMCISFIIAVSLAVFALSVTAGAPLVSIFSPEGTPVYNIAREGFRIFSVSFLFCGINIFASAFFTALSNGKASAVISSLRTFVFIVFFLLTLPPIFGETGVWMAVPLSEAGAMVVSAGFLVKSRDIS